MPLAPAAFTAPLGLHPDLHLSTFSVRTGDRLLFFTDGLLEAFLEQLDLVPDAVCGTWSRVDDA